MYSGMVLPPVPYPSAQIAGALCGDAGATRAMREGVLQCLLSRCRVKRAAEPMGDGGEVLFLVERVEGEAQAEAFRQRHLFFFVFLRMQGAVVAVVFSEQVATV